jgi:type VI secretion system protein ImpF
MFEQANNRLQPCLLSRLSDDEPGKQDEGRSERIVSLSRYKESVLRDMQWLLNTNAHFEGEVLYDDPELRTSVLNFGIRDLSGLVSDSVDVQSYRQHIIDTLHAFEPRLNRQKLEVRFLDQSNVSRKERQPTTLFFEIRGELFARPLPERFLARTEIDLETGLCQIR